MAEPTKKKILSKIEWFLLAFALGILAMVVLQKFGINMIETTEKVEISQEEQRARAEDDAAKEINTFHGEKKSQAGND